MKHLLKLLPSSLKAILFVSLFCTVFSSCQENVTPREIDEPYAPTKPKFSVIMADGPDDPYEPTKPKP